MTSDGACAASYCADSEDCLGRIAQGNEVLAGFVAWVDDVGVEIGGNVYRSGFGHEGKGVRKRVISLAN